jgi:hypothetical protein
MACGNNVRAMILEENAQKPVFPQGKIAQGMFQNHSKRFSEAAWPVNLWYRRENLG